MRKVKINIEKVMESRGIKNLTELSAVSGVRRAALSELINGKRQRIEFEHIEKIADALVIDDINEILSIENNS